MKFTVIVCTYNYAHLLPDALRSLAAQTFPDFELLIVDDGSTDNTEEVVRQFRNQFRQCLYLQKPHTGLADSRNFGIRAATGSHIAFLDADDLWSPEYLQTMKTVWETHPQAELVSADVLIVQASGTIVGSLYPPGLPALCGPITSRRDLFYFFRHSTPSALSLRKSLYERIGPFDVRLSVFGQDWHWVIRAVLDGAFCVRLPQRLIIYRLHGSNLTHQSDKMFEAWLWIYTDTMRYATDPEAEAYARRFTRRYLPGLLSRYPAGKNRVLLDRAIKTFGGDRYLRTVNFLTYFGLCYLAKWGRLAKHASFNIKRKKRTIDLTASPSVMFEAVSE